MPKQAATYSKWYSDKKTGFCRLGSGTIADDLTTIPKTITQTNSKLEKSQRQFDFGW